MTLFAYPEDHGDFAQAQRRCVGIGKCRQSSGGVMCPSYQATRDELHSTRGRAHLLWEMLEGDVVTDGWRSTEVRDALDLCLSCKGCLSDCPVNVDMATYKAEFTHHHYAGRPWARPLSHWSMGWLPLWSRVAARAPKTANRLARGRLVKRLGGIAPEREIPPFAEQTFAAWFAGRPAPKGDGDTVLLWPDSFTNHLAPQVGRAAVAVLEAAGYRVVLPDGPVCCGLTWISTGQLGTARTQLRRSLTRLAPHLDAGTPIVGLEPSCTAVLRRDAADLLPDDPRAARLAEQTQTFAEFVVASGWRPPTLDIRALVQTHCHQHAVLGFDADRALLAAAGVDRRAAGLRMLWAGRQFRLRAGPLRGVPAGGGAGAAAGGARGRSRHRRGGRRVQLPHPDRARHPAAGRAPGRVVGPRPLSLAAPHAGSASPGHRPPVFCQP